MKILMMVPCWHRPEIVEMFIHNIGRTQCDFELIPYFILSPEDQDCRRLEELTDGFQKVWTVNTPLGRKMNEGARKALSLEWDYLMGMGSDTLYTSLLFDLLKPYLESGAAYFGLKDMYSYNPFLNQAVYLSGYHLSLKDEVTAHGLGRCIRRDVVENCMPLWDDTAPFGMDGHSDFKLNNKGFDCTVIDNGRAPVVCEVKTNVCLTCWDNYDDMGEAADVDWVKFEFGIDRTNCYDLSDFADFHTAVLKVGNETGNKERAFNLINEAHRQQTGQNRYANYGSYRSTVSQKFNKHEGQG